MKRITSRASGAAVAVLASLFVLISSAGLAQVPQTISYQGALTDSSGAPVSGIYDISFTLYDAAVGGSVLWGDTQSVAVANGAFSAVFGADVGNPLDPSVFENPVYLGIQVLAGPGVPVGGDPEMTPRQALTAVGYAMRAKTVEVDTLNALGCADGEVAKFAGGVWTCAVDATGGVAADLVCTSCVAEGELGFDTATQSELNAHAGDPAAHHGRYTDAEAVAAVGPHVTSVDGLSGGAITSSIDVTGTVSATDLAVSSTGLVANLNADRLDDLQASEIVAAAQDEVRIPITALPFTISVSGSYYLTGDLSSGSNGISVNADNVTIDLMGYSLIGPGAAGFGIVMTGRSNVEIRNGTVRGFSIGVNENGAAGNTHRVVAVRAVSNATIGINLSGQSHLVKDSTVAGNGSSGMLVGTATTVTGNTAYNNLSRGISTLAGARVSGNTAYNNSLEGIFTGFGATVTGNVAHDNGGDGILTGSGSTVTGNASYLNGDDGIFAGNGVTVSGNSVHLNNGTGIRTGSNCTVTDNTVLQNNGVVAAADGGGIRVITGSQVKGNTLSSNSENGIVAGGGDSVIEENLVTFSPNGINFLVGGNFYANNRFSGNTADTAGVGGQTDGGGNVSF